MWKFHLFRAFVLYYVPLSGAILGISLKWGLSPYLTAGILMVLIPAVVGYIWLENKHTLLEEREIKEGSKDSGLIFDLIENLSTVKYGARDDERIAELANKILRSDLDKFSIRYHAYRRWREKNPLIFSAILDNHSELIGFFDVIPIRDIAAKRILTGTFKERTLELEDVVKGDRESLSGCHYLYIASLLINRQQHNISAIVAREIIVLKIYEHILENYAPLDNIKIIAFAYTESGEKLLQRAGFKMIFRARDNVQKKPLYLLDSETANLTRQRYERIHQQLAVRRSTGRPKMIRSIIPTQSGSVAQN